MPDLKTTEKLKLGLPKGSLQKQTIDLFEKAGFNIYGHERSYRPAINDPEITVRVLRAQEIGRYVDHGFLDCGITGEDWIAENNANVETLCELQYSRTTDNPTRWVLVVPEDSPIQSVKDLEGKTVATEALGLTRDYFKEKNVNANVEFSWGATEVKVPELVDAIVDVTETGSSLRANKLRIVDTIMTSCPQFIANPTAASDPWKMDKMTHLSLLLKGALAARDKVGIKMNVPKNDLQKILKSIPSLHQPTVSPLWDDAWVAVETVMDESQVREIIPLLQQHGATGIIEFPLNKVIP
ncbi:MAG: ATP phosphoribosyltransferase [Verrucomicrobiota bacterium]